jgi:hypothetical protein
MNTLLAIRKNLPEDLEERRTELATHLKASARIIRRIALIEAMQQLMGYVAGEDDEETAVETPPTTEAPEGGKRK